MINFGFDYLGKIRTVNLYNKVKTSIKMEARSETDTNKCCLSNRGSSKRYFTTFGAAREMEACLHFRVVTKVYRIFYNVEFDPGSG